MVDIKQEEKINKYLDLAVEIKELWKMKSAKVVPVVIGALGTIPKRLKDYLRNINAGIDLVHFKEQVLPGSTRILGKVLKFWGSFLRPDIYDGTEISGIDIPAVKHAP